MPDSPRLVALATAVPPHVIRQADVRKVAAYLFADILGAERRLLQVFDHMHIQKRHLCVPLEWLAAEHSFVERNDAYIESAVRLAGEAAQKALDRVGLSPGDIDHLVFVSSTGIATPSVDARLFNAMDFRSDCRRTPIWGLGCAGGVAGLARAADFARADPTARVLLVALEICSLTFQRNDLSRGNLVATSLFADGAAAAVVAGADATGYTPNGQRPLEAIAAHSTLWRDSLDVMGWNIDGDGLHVVFAQEIPDVVRERVRPSLESFLQAQNMRLDALDHFAFHPGGDKVLAACTDALQLSPDALRHSREVLREYGNMSSPTCLFVLERFLAAGDIAAGDTAVVSALGPGFSAEYVLLRGAAD